ncbi:2-dehydropantoate 2-reductase family protein [Saccharata proteae CBS 121410]|uniref:2-dehydropantoate 2-reductase n=1 Tax=Saccharata proteae CBS 121410 TaxID=1314787 RepID=A0A9P4HVN4_9PEZI|nr:2-dehydropantoate 2-reductase family protein [Saccharata proteae CBS 121410]
MATQKANVLLFGSGGVGTIAALNLEVGGLANVTAVLRSNYEAVQKSGFHIKSCDHGTITGWRPSQVVNTVPSVHADSLPAYDFIVCSTKNVPDNPPSLPDQIASAVTPGHTVIVLIQNGLNIERPLFAAFPQNIVLSGVSMIGSHEISHGVIEHDDNDRLVLGPFHNPNLDAAKEEAAAKRFVEIYAAGGKTACEFTADVGFSRWRKLVYNSCLNSICAITGLDTGRIRLADGAIENLVKPAMEEIRAAAKAAGHELPPEVVDTMINIDPLTMYLPPSMLNDLRKGNFIEVENILGEPLREGTALGVPMPTLKVLYGICKAIQWRTKESRGLVEIPAKGNFVAN